MFTSDVHQRVPNQKSHQEQQAEQTRTSEDEVKSTTQIIQLYPRKKISPEVNPISYSKWILTLRCWLWLYLWMSCEFGHHARSRPKLEVAQGGLKGPSFKCISTVRCSSPNTGHQLNGMWNPSARPPTNIGLCKKALSKRKVFFPQGSVHFHVSWWEVSPAPSPGPDFSPSGFLARRPCPEGRLPWPPTFCFVSVGLEVATSR